MLHRPVGRAVKRFSTMRVGLTLLAVIIVLAVTGTLIPQERDIHAAGPVLKFLYNTVGLGNLYHSWWFGALLFLLCLNVACCTAIRLPALWRETFVPPTWLADFVPQRQCRVAATPEETTARLRGALVSAGFRIWAAGEGCLYARKGMVAPWGTFLVHVSILLIALGGFYGSTAGFQYSIQLAPGEAVAIGSGNHPGVGRPFGLRLDAFDTEFYSNGQVSDWISSVTVVQGGRDILSQAVKVNHPLSYQGVSFYQASYASLYALELRSEGGTVRSVRAGEKQPLIIDERMGIAVVPLKYLPDFDPRQPMVSRTTKPDNPHVVFAAYSGGRPLGMNAVKLGEPLKFPGTTVELVFRSVRESSGLDVKYDPGLPLVFAGFAVMAAAFFLSLYPRRRVIQAEVTPDGSLAKLAISLHGRSPLLADELTALCETVAGAARR